MVFCAVYSAQLVTYLFLGEHDNSIMRHALENDSPLNLLMLFIGNNTNWSAWYTLKGIVQNYSELFDTIWNRIRGNKFLFIWWAV